MPRLPIQLQTSPLECGPVCLWMVAAYHGCTLSLDEIRQRCKLGWGRTSLAQLYDAAERIEFRALSARLSMEHLRRVKLPCIALIEDRHFVVIERATRRQ